MRDSNSPSPSSRLPGALAQERSRVLDRWLGTPSGVLWAVSASLRPLQELWHEAAGVGLQWPTATARPLRWDAAVAARLTAPAPAASTATPPRALWLAVPPQQDGEASLPTGLWEHLTNRMTLGQRPHEPKLVCWLEPGGADRLPSDWIRTGCFWTPSPQWQDLRPRS